MHRVIQDCMQGSNAEFTHVTVGFSGTKCCVKLILECRIPAL